MMMKRACAVMILFGLSTLTPAIVAVAAPAAPLQQGSKAANNGGERHPRIRAAIKELQEA
jgi:hypothetical protein